MDRAGILRRDERGIAVADRLDRFHSHHEGEEDADGGMAAGAVDESMDEDSPMSETSE